MAPFVAPEATDLPVAVADLEISEPIPRMSELVGSAEEPELSPGRARCLVRLHGCPLGELDLVLRDGDCSPDAVAQHLWSEFGEAIAEHLRADDLPVPAGLSRSGLPPADHAPCGDRLRRALTERPSVSVVVPTRDRPDDLRRCLESILRSTYPRDSLELLVIDNAPRTDSTLQVVETAFAGAPITYHREDAVGSSAARNAGLRLASGVFTLFADDDVVVDEDWLAHLVATLLADPEVICATGLVLPLELDTRAQLLFEQFGGFSKGVVPRVYDLEKNRPEHPLFPFNLGSFGSGNNAGFRTSALRKLGGFDTALGPGTSTRAGEDIEVFARCVFEGHALAYEPNAMVRHRHRRSDSELRQQLFNYGTGLSAALVKVLIRHPRQIPPFLFRLPYGLFFTLSRKSEKNSGMTAEYPRALRLAELRGMVRGPFAYLAERRRVARTRSSAAV